MLSLLDTTIAHESITVPNQFPSVASMPYRLAIVGEAPGAEEVAERQPFVGASGQFLNALLHSAGIVRAACFVGNVVQIRPSNNDIKNFAIGGTEFTEGIARLSADLRRYQPHCVLLLGNTALGAFFSGAYAISDWRGSIFLSDKVPLEGFKCVASYHPAAVLRQYNYAPILGFDLKRAKEESHYYELNLPQRTFNLHPTVDEILQSLANIPEGALVSFDIEGGTYGIPCCSVAASATSAFIIPFRRAGTDAFSLEDEARIWQALAQVLENPLIPKVLQNSLYDRFVLAHSHGVLIRGISNDTMLKHWERYSELEKNLGLQASLYTREPFYKSDRHSNSEQTFFEYCCKDSAVTFEINERLEVLLPHVGATRHYRFNMEMLNPLLYMELRGIGFSEERATAKKGNLARTIAELQGKVEAIVGHTLNVESSKQMVEYLYKEREFKIVTNRKTGKPTADYSALLGLAKKTNDPILMDIIKLRASRTRLSMLGATTDPDGRMRCSYNLVGTDTGRLSCSTSVAGSGFNLQTVPEEDRDLFLADPDNHFFQCDLSGADGWTVAAHCQRLGDPTMLDDLLGGVKIAKVIALMFLKGPQISRLHRNELKILCEGVGKNEPIYFGSKCCQHGSNYGMHKTLLSMTIFLQSEGTINISAADAERLQRFYHLRYPGVAKWHKWVASEIVTKKTLTSASGHSRRFFGRPTDPETLRAALSNEPQENTTYATNLAAHKLWHDPENRRQDGSLIIEPLHQVHDALCGQFRKEDTAFALPKIRSYFNNPLEIAGQQITIPFEGRYGQSWGEMGERI